jgi:hypothetical protein
VVPSLLSLRLCLLNYTDIYQRYMGTNIPGKAKEALNYGGGIPLYVKTINDVLTSGYEGFVVQ